MPSDRPLADLRFLMFVDHDYEDLELWYPKLRLIEAGGHVTVAGPKAETVYRGKHGYPCKSDVAIELMEVADFHGMVIPGGFMPDKLRREEKVKNLTSAFAKSGKLVAAICHGDLENAGAIWEDAAVVVDRHFVSSRKPDDLPEFCRAILEVMSGVLR